MMTWFWQKVKRLASQKQFSQFFALSSPPAAMSEGKQAKRVAADEPDPPAPKRGRSNKAEKCMVHFLSFRSCRASECSCFACV
jgi:hypothetical protein